MAGNLNLYYNESGTRLVKSDPTDGCFTINLGPKVGIDGDSGMSYTQIYYIYNDGDTVARNATIREVGDTSNYFKLSLYNYTTSSWGELHDVSLVLGDINPKEKVKIAIISIVPKGSQSEAGTLKYELYSYTLPNKEYILETIDATDTSEDPVTNSTTHVDADDSHGGKPYGDGAYGRNTLYGQEGLIHVKKQINTISVIAGMSYTNIEADYIIRAHYTGKEKNIEDIQSFYSRNYYDLDAYDGPILPLFLDDVDEGNTEVALW